MNTSLSKSLLLPGRFSLDAVAAALNATVDEVSSTAITGVSTDTRNLAPGNLFFAIRGDTFDGHNFVATAESRSAAAAVVDMQVTLAEIGIPLLRVVDTTEALGSFAKACRRRSDAKVIAVTGSNGKTTVKTFLGALLQRFGPTTFSPLSYNNNIGVPLTIFSSKQDDRWLVVEMGTNHFGELSELASIAEPDVAIVTNIGDTHLEFLGDRDGVARAKAELIEAMDSNGIVVLNADDQYFEFLKDRTDARVVSFGTTSEADIFAAEIAPSPRGVQFMVNGVHRAELGVPGSYNVTNSLAVLAAGYASGLPLDEMVDGVTDFELPKLRMQAERIGPVQVVLDAYNANPTSMSFAVEEFARWPVTGRRLCILGEMGELGEASCRFHEDIGQQYAQHDFDLLFTIGPAAETLCRSAVSSGVESRSAVHLPTTHDAAQEIIRQIRPGDTLFLKGSRSNRLETVADELRIHFNGGTA